MLGGFPRWAALLAVGLGGGAAEAQVATAPAVAPAVARVSAPVLPAAVLTVDPGRLQAERAANAVVGATHATVSRYGVPSPYAAGAPREISLREAVLAALAGNLAIRRSGLSKAIAEQALLEAEALFDPVFVGTLTANQVSRHSRTEDVKRFHPATIRVPVGESDPTGAAECSQPRANLTVNGDAGKACYFIVFGKGKAVEFVQYDQFRGSGYRSETLAANDLPQTQPRRTHKESGIAALYQQLPWGSVLDGSLTLNRQQSFYALNEVSSLPGAYGSYRRPWTASVAVGASVPLPFTRNFGPTAAAEYSRGVAELGVSAAELDTRGVVNATLLQVETAYWGLVGAVQRLNASAESVARAEEMRGHILRLFNESILTEADRAQADSNVARIQATQQQVFAEFVAASEALRELTNSADPVLFVPVGYRALLDRPVAMAADPQRTLDNPSVRRTAIGVQIATLARVRKEALTRPDVTLRADLALSQSSGVFGYSRMWESLGRIGNPDQTAASLRLLFQRPWGNRAAEAGLEGARHDEQRQSLLLRKVEEQLREEFEAARTQLASATERGRIARRNLELEQAMYDRVARLQQEKLITPYETIARLNSLLNARIAVIQADIDARMLQARLLYSTGALAEQYGERSAQTDGDRERMAGLRDAGVLRIFGGPL